MAQLRPWFRMGRPSARQVWVALELNYVCQLALPVASTPLFVRSRNHTRKAVGIGCGASRVALPNHPAAINRQPSYLWQRATPTLAPAGYESTASLLQSISQTQTPAGPSSSIDPWFCRFAAPPPTCVQKRKYPRLLPASACFLPHAMTSKTMPPFPFRARFVRGPEPLWELGLADNFITEKGLEELLRPRRPGEQ